MKRTIVILCGLAVLLSACERKIPYDGEYQDPKLVIQTMLAEGDSTILCYVSRSAFFLDTKGYDLSQGVTLTVTRGNGTSLSMDDNGMTNATQRLFVVPLTSPLQAGEVVRIQASHPDYPTAYGQDTVMPRPAFTVTSCVWDAEDYVCRVKIRVGENSDLHGVLAVRGGLTYQWTVDDSSGKEVYTSTTKYIQSKDNIFASLGNAFSTDYGYNAREEMYIKADEARNKEITIEFPLSGSYYTPVSATVQLIALSSDAYLYRRAMYSYFGAFGVTDIDLGAEISGMFGIEETVQLYSNIEDGYGIVAGQSATTQTVDL